MSIKSKKSMSVALSSRKIFIYLLSVNLLLLLLFVISQYITYDRTDPSLWRHQITAVLSVTNEVSIPTWYSQALLVVAGLLLLFISTAAENMKKQWFLLGLIFVYLSMDEGAAIHELLITPFQKIFNISGGIFYFAWVIPVSIIIIFLIIYFLKFYLHLPKKTRKLMASSFVVFVCGALVMEMLGALYVTGTDIATRNAHTIGNVLTGIEEFMEMLGVSIFIYTLCDYVVNSKTVDNVLMLRIGR